MVVAPGAHVADDVPPGVIWIRDGWVGLNHLTIGDAVLTGEALRLCTSKRNLNTGDDDSSVCERRRPWSARRTACPLLME